MSKKTRTLFSLLLAFLIGCGALFIIFLAAQMLSIFWMMDWRIGAGVTSFFVASCVTAFLKLEGHI